ncbi:hypothetical protein [Chryseobacterium terrae]|uniref:Uncharacterized protein n=1 Tax=Chryseobacterium terrae TaxID=3163299 RepID=A0ABW8Y4Z5_9FLAO
MSFPKHKILPANGDHPLFAEAYRKRIGFSPLTFCEFFQGMDVLQVMGEETKEYIYGLYFGGRLVGTAYFGNLYSDEMLLKIKKEFFPTNWEDIQKYVREKSGVWYAKMHPSQYAFVFDKVLKKIE